MQLLEDVPELADTRMLQWTGILGDSELHIVANASENERSATINLRGHRLTDESSLRRSSILAAEELTDGVHRQDQQDSHATLVQDPPEDLHQCRAASRKAFRDVSRLSLLICPTLESGILPTIDYLSR